MKRETRNGEPAGEGSDCEMSFVGYLDAVRAELAGLSALGEEMVIPLSGGDSVSVAEYDKRFGKSSTCYVRSSTMAMPCPTPMHMAHSAKRPCRRRSS